MISEEKVIELREKLEEEVDLSEIEKSMTYSLADAIREGSTVTCQANGTYSSQDGEKLCAMSAALLALKARRISG